MADIDKQYVFWITRSGESPRPVRSLWRHEIEADHERYQRQGYEVSRIQIIDYPRTKVLPGQGRRKAVTSRA